MNVPVRFGVLTERDAEGCVYTYVGPTVIECIPDWAGVPRRPACEHAERFEHAGHLYCRGCGVELEPR